MIKEYVKNILEKGYIRPSTSPYTISVLIIKKPDSRLRIYIDYRALNALIIKNRNISPLIRKILARLYVIKIFIKFNIIAAFNKIRIKIEKEEKTAFLI